MANEDKRAQEVMADLQAWARLHDREPAIVLIDAATLFLRIQGAAGYAELN